MRDAVEVKRRVAGSRRCPRDQGTCSRVIVVPREHRSFDHIRRLIVVVLDLLEDRIIGEQERIIARPTIVVTGVGCDRLADTVVLRLGERLAPGGITLDHRASFVIPGLVGEGIADHTHRASRGSTTSEKHSTSGVTQRAIATPP